LAGRRQWRATRGGSASTRAILCFLPRGLAVNPLKTLLGGYTLAAADCWSSALRLARRKPVDLYLLYLPLLWTEAAALCRSIRARDPQTPIIVYSVQPTAAERRDVLATGCVQAYLPRSDEVHNLAATAGQLIMLAELRSVDAIDSRAQTLQDRIARCLEKLGGVAGAAALPVPKRLLMRLKIEACRVFSDAGGTPANFQRLWPSIYERALGRAVRSAR
jgi:CheY-like chemotaxis protein